MTLTTIPAQSLAEACRYLHILAVRRKDETAINLWRARAMSAAALTGATETIAGLILQSFFFLTKTEAYAEARLVLNELLRLIPESHPRAALFRGRLFHEKLAYSFLKEKQYDEAILLYLEAAKHCKGDVRGGLKVRGGAAIAGYLAQHHPKEGNVKNHSGVYVKEMEKVAAAAKEHGFPDVLLAAESNLDFMKTGESETWCAFETG